MGANPVQVEMGEFEDGAEETVEEVVAESKSLLTLGTSGLPLPAWRPKDSSQEVSDQGDALWGPGSCGRPAGNPQARGVWDRVIYSQARPSCEGQRKLHTWVSHSHRSHGHIWSPRFPQGLSLGSSSSREPI